MARRLVGARSLAHSIRKKQLYRWWYLAEHDPLDEHLRRDPRFQALDEQAWQHVEQQRSLLEEMRAGALCPGARRSTYQMRLPLPWNTLLAGLTWIIQIVSPLGGST